ncbi:MAG: Intracellular distribution of mitochondria [Watsoniomyces obsoletus]|nr:MAG: Intracellular distribution of mitochondria [Watsoniomyces obsoletus]
MDDDLPPEGLPRPRRRQADHQLDGVPGGRNTIWTAARCNRLLRPIISKLDILRKAAENQRRVAATKAKKKAARDARKQEAASQDGKTSLTTTEPLPEDRDPAAASQEPEWISRRAGQRGSRITYSNRGSGSSGHGGLGNGTVININTPGRVTVSTPILQRVVEESSDSDDDEDESESDNDSDNESDGDDEGAGNGGGPSEGTTTAQNPSAGPQRRRANHIRSQYRNKIKTPSPALLWGFPDNESVGVWTSCFASFSMLLRYCSYENSNRRPHRGARSLFSMCLKQLPQSWINEDYSPSMDEEEEEDDEATIWTCAQRAVKEFQNDAMIDMYNELETTWCMGEGWKPLHEVLRAHAITLMECAMADRIITVECALNIMIVYQHHGLFEAVESLIRTTIDAYPLSVKPPELESDMFVGYGVTRCGTNLLMGTPEACPPAIQYRQLARLLDTGAIDPSWLVTQKFTMLWDKAISSICEDDADSGDAGMFLETAIRAALGLPGDEIIRSGSSGMSSGKEKSSEIITGRGPAAVLPCTGYPPGNPGTSEEQQMDIKLSNAVDRLVSSLMEGLAGILVLGNARHGNTYTPRSTPGRRKIVNLISSLMTRIQRELIFNWKSQPCDWTLTRRMFMTVHAMLLAGFGNPSGISEKCVQSTYEALTVLRCLFMMLTLPDGGKTMAENLLDATRQSLFRIAHCCSRATRNGAPEILKVLVDNLVEVANHDRTYAHVSGLEWRLLRHMIVNAVLRPVTDDDKQPQSQWALEIREVWGAMKKSSQRSDQGSWKKQVSAAAGLLLVDDPLNSWEEDLCRRLASTPGISSRCRLRDLQGSESSEDEEEEDEGTMSRRRQLLKEVETQTRFESPVKLSQMLLGNTPVSKKNSGSIIGRNTSPSPEPGNGRRLDPRQQKNLLPLKEEEKAGHEKKEPSRKGKEVIRSTAPAAAAVAPTTPIAKDFKKSQPAVPVKFAWSPGSPMLEDPWHGKSFKNNNINKNSIIPGIASQSHISNSTRTFQVYQGTSTAAAALGISSIGSNQAQVATVVDQSHPPHSNTTAATKPSLKDVTNIDFHPRYLPSPETEKEEEKEAQKEKERKKALKIQARKKIPLPARPARHGQGQGQASQSSFSGWFRAKDGAALPKRKWKQRWGGIAGYWDDNREDSDDVDDDSEDELCR